MVGAKAGCFVGRFDSLRLPFDGIARRASSAHRDENCDMAQHSQSTKNVANLLFLISIPERLEVVDHDTTGLFNGIEFRNNLFECYLLVSRYLQLSGQNLEEKGRRCRFNTRHSDNVYTRKPLLDER